MEAVLRVLSCKDWVFFVCAAYELLRSFGSRLIT